jgi:hypothetical protein
MPCDDVMMSIATSYSSYSVLYTSLLCIANCKVQYAYYDNEEDYRTFHYLGNQMKVKRQQAEAA